MTHQEETKRLINNHHRRRQKLKEQQALQGISADPKIMLEIEDIEAEIERLQVQLAEIKVDETSDNLIDSIPPQPSDVEQMKYYLYVSKFKVDMLWSQIPGIVNEGNVRHNTQQLYTRLRAVVQYIDNTSEVGTIDDPKSYFRGKLPMSWAILGAPPAMGADDYLESVVYFGGNTQKTVLGLGGSAKHLTGILESKSRVTMSNSSSTALLFKLSQELKQKGVIDEFDKPPPLHHVALTTKEVCAAKPAEFVEFLAKKLNSEAGILLGTPIYVAIAD
jgi:hypothetical protein